MARTCVFCSIEQGETPAAVAFEDETTLAFLDHHPLFEGHVLVIPRVHVETLTDLDPAAVGPFFGRVQRLAGAVERAMDAQGTFVAMNNRISQSVPHLHVHVVPRRKKDGLRGFFWPRTKYTSKEAMDAVASRIRQEMTAS